MAELLDRHPGEERDIQPGSARGETGAAGIGRKVIPRVRTPVCCVQYAMLSGNAACNAYCTP